MTDTGAGSSLGLSLLTEDSMSLATVTEVQSMLGIADDLDGRLPALIDTASELIEEYLNRRLVKEERTQHCPGGGQIIYLSAFPVESVAEVTRNGELCVDWYLDPEYGILVRKAGWPQVWPGYQVVYTGGYEPAAIPMPIKQACAMLVLGLNGSLTHSGQKVASEAIGDYRVTYAAEPARGKGIEMLSPVAASLLRPYRRITF